MKVSVSQDKLKGVCRVVGFPGDSEGKEFTCSSGDLGLIQVWVDPTWLGKIPWRREWLPTPVFLPGEFHGQRSLGGYILWSRRVRHDWVTNTFTFFHIQTCSPGLQSMVVVVVAVKKPWRTELSSSSAVLSRLHGHSCPPLATWASVGFPVHHTHLLRSNFSWISWAYNCFFSWPRSSLWQMSVWFTSKYLIFIHSSIQYKFIKHLSTSCWGHGTERDCWDAAQWKSEGSRGARWAAWRKHLLRGRMPRAEHCCKALDGESCPRGQQFSLCGTSKQSKAKQLVSGKSVYKSLGRQMGGGCSRNWRQVNTVEVGVCHVGGSRS